MAVLVVVVLILAMTGHSRANWCVCRSDVSDSALQKALDYACGAGADCTPILQNGACYQPNTVRGHCSYAVNSYFQKKGQAQGTCDFAGAAQVVTSDPSTVGSCAYPATSSSAGTTTSTPNTTPSTSTTPSTTTPSTTTPTTSTTSPTTNGGIIGGGFSSGLGPSGTGINTDNSAAFALSLQKAYNLISLLLTIWFSGSLFLRS